MLTVLAGKDWNNSKVSISALLESFYTKDACNTRLLSVALVLISRSSLSSKAQVMYDIYARKEEGCIDREGVVMCVADGFDVSVRNIPRLVVKESRQERIKKYIGKLEGVRERYVEAQVQEVVRDEDSRFNRQSFVEIFTKKCAFLMASSSVREKAHELYKIGRINIMK